MGLLILVELAALAVSIWNYRRHRTLRIFTWYTMFSLVQLWFEFVYVNAGEPVILRNIGGGISNVFMLFEFLVCILYIVRNISSRSRKIAIFINAALYLGLIVAASLRNYHILYRSSFFFTESFFLLLPCLLYFYDLFVSGHPVLLKNEPAFWIVTGFLFLNAGSIPMYIAEEFGDHYSIAIYSLNYILYTVLFVLLIRAYRCPPVNPSLHARTQ